MEGSGTIVTLGLPESSGMSHPPPTEKGLKTIALALPADTSASYTDANRTRRPERRARCQIPRADVQNPISEDRGNASAP